MTKLKEISFGANLIRCGLVEKDTAHHGEASCYLNLTKKSVLLLAEHPLELQALRGRAVAELVPGIAQGMEHLCAVDLCRRVYLLDGGHHLVGGEPVSGL